MSVFGGDYLGFSYNGVHSSELGIIRVSDGSRYNENLLPTSKDITVQVPGGDGTYYFGSYFTQRPITISYAFDELTEIQLRRLKELLGDKQVHSLIFDENPYKIYYAKVAGTTQIKYIPFDYINQRIYKGEGSIQFVCYQPYAVCKKKFLNEYDDLNKEEWAEASGLLEDNSEVDFLSNGIIKVYNPGVKSTDWRITFNLNEENEAFSSVTFSMEGVGTLIFDGCMRKSKNGHIDSRLIFNSKTKMVEGFYEENGQYYKSGNLYNEYISTGDFFDIPVTMNTKEFFVSSDNEFISIDYNYYYY